MHEFRKRFVVLHHRRISNQVIRRCYRCKLQRARPMAPEMAALPQVRLAVNRRPFSFTGTDLFGPLTITIGRRKEKRWGIIFTCLTTRAVYLDLVASLSAKACMMAMDGLARRGPPLQFHSDNGTNFVATAKQYVDIEGRRPRWVFNAPHAPHTGGAWERLIGVTKKALQRMGLEEEPHEERLRWLLHKAEYLINSRPLVDLCSDDGATVLTPNDILIGRGEIGAELDRTIEESEGADFMAEQDERVQHFWQWWTANYLPTVAARSKWTQKTENLQVGDVVFLCDSDYRRGWRKGRVVTTFVDEEAQQVREVTVRTGDSTVYRRHVAKVAPIVRGEGASCSKGECAMV